MYINTEKTTALLVTEKRLQHKISEETTSVNLCLDGTNIDQLSHHQLLGKIENFRHMGQKSPMLTLVPEIAYYMATVVVYFLFPQDFFFSVKITKY